MEGTSAFDELAIKGKRVWAIGRPLPMGALMKSMRSASLYIEKLRIGA